MLDTTNYHKIYTFRILFWNFAESQLFCRSYSKVITGQYQVVKKPGDSLKNHRPTLIHW